MLTVPEICSQDVEYNILGWDSFHSRIVNLLTRPFNFPHNFHNQETALSTNTTIGHGYQILNRSRFFFILIMRVFPWYITWQYWYFIRAKNLFSFWTINSIIQQVYTNLLQNENFKLIFWNKQFQNTNRTQLRYKIVINLPALFHMPLPPSYKVTQEYRVLYLLFFYWYNSSGKNSHQRSLTLGFWQPYPALQNTKYFDMNIHIITTYKHVMKL